MSSFAVAARVRVGGALPGGFGVKDDDIRFVSAHQQPAVVHSRINAGSPELNRLRGSGSSFPGGNFPAAREPESIGPPPCSPRQTDSAKRDIETDGNDRFELTDMPAPEFFVHVDGSTATNVPPNFTYPNVGKSFHSVPGQTIQLEMDREVFDIFLPLMAHGDVQPLSSTEPTKVGFGDFGKSELLEILPDVDPTLFDLMKVTIEPGAAVDLTDETPLLHIPKELEAIHNRINTVLSNPDLHPSRRASSKEKIQGLKDEAKYWIGFLNESPVLPGSSGRRRITTWIGQPASSACKSALAPTS